ncbi:PREDICTED: ras-specific guanine nucleotide-releasing factor RalGPS2-like isoform X3 [Nicrophorus vespilloides]|uniref:Ras-specific guanine nucleotide-releasing factor RalGPS2-like isoform X3 n=1 Tax=Nicrophorus vespilloides TaxID=110193 RepID=A0ABM1NDL0_NICVS|nr:PREDICTED: ras-specific guanine nucleotide-releasing factor RalGPS2-like isoform X3 [Nicrophorus vespilloides]
MVLTLGQFYGKYVSMVVRGHEKMLRYSEIPRNISGESFTKLKASNSQDEDYKDGGNSKKGTFSCSSGSSGERERKVSSKSVSGGPGPPDQSYYNYSSSTSFAAVPASVKTQSLPNSARNYSCPVFDVLRISPEELANQVTLLDLPPFLHIQPDELTSCAWNKKNKLTVAPNIVAFTRRFNHVSFWTVQEILSGATAKQRSEILGHFVKIAKKLYELNNLHSLFAIISALQSASVYRLSKTWAYLSKKDRQSFEKLAEVFSDNNNWSNLRSHIESLKLPCIPYLGLYLTDLVYIDMAHPHSGGLESQQRSLKMNNILRIISNYQHSNYSQLAVLPHVRDYLHSIRYIEELQKFVEDDQYKLSLKLEPPSPPPSSSSCSSKESVIVDATAIASLNLSPAKASSGSLRLHAVTAGSRFIPGHRKCRSLGTKFRSTSLPRNFHKQGGPLFGYSPIVVPWGIFGKNQQVVEPSDVPKALHLLDDSELEESQGARHHLNLPSPTIDLPLEASRNTSEETTLLTRLTDDCDDQTCSMQGCVRRKTLLKHGRKPTVTSWQRYWIQIWASSLAYFTPKSFKGTQRSDFKREPCKLVSLTGCHVLLGDNSLHPDLFKIVDHQRGNIYKFKAGTSGMAERWIRHIQQAARSEQSPLPTNLMTFE